MFKYLLASAALIGCSTLVGQSTAVLPPAFESLPGNAGVAMPLRWSKGKLQVFIDPVMMPSLFVGETITGLRLRRSTLVDSPAFPAMTRTMEIRGGFQTFLAANVTGGAAANALLSNPIVLFGPALVTIPATPEPGPNTIVGDEFVQITFTQPLPVTAGTLFLQFETLDGPLVVAADNWVDAVQWDTGTDDGYVVTIGDGTCTTNIDPVTMEVIEPTELKYTSSASPISGSTVNLEVTGAPPTSGTALGLVVVWMGLDPTNQPSGPTFVGYGGSFGAADPAMVDCFQWAPFDFAWFGPTDATGKFATTLDISGLAGVSYRLSLQAAWFDDSRPVIPLSFSNGLQLVCNSVGVEGNCNSFFFPGDLDTSPWGPQIGLMPVILLDY
ncbi:MAG: hypothetical protein ACI8UD_001439 [Planctomycetota bacterium]|jgi:hypothetical protein